MNGTNTNILNDAMEILRYVTVGYGWTVLWYAVGASFVSLLALAAMTPPRDKRR